MSSSGSAQAGKRTAALANLRSSRRNLQTAQKNGSASSDRAAKSKPAAAATVNGGGESSASSTAPRSAEPAAPAQMRDATQNRDWVRSRFFNDKAGSASSSSSDALNTPNKPTVLVPNSSPLAPAPGTLESLSYKPHQSHHASSGPLTKGSSTWMPSRPMKNDDDILTSTTIFHNSFAPVASRPASSSSTSTSALTRKIRDDDGLPDQPRKRPNLGTASNGTTSQNPISTDDSPRPSQSSGGEEITRIEKRVSLVHVDSAPITEDEDDIPDARDLVGRPNSPPRRRLMRGTRPPPPPSPSVISISSSPVRPESKSQDALNRIISVNPSVRSDEVRQIWKEEGGDEKRTAERVQRITSRIRSGRSASVSTVAPPTKGNKKSAIYSKRGVVEPIQAPSIPRETSLKRKQSLLRGKDDSSDFDTSDSEGGSRSRRSNNWKELAAEREEKKREESALKWFNDANEDAIVELTACSKAQAQLITSLRPFTDVDDLQRKLSKKKGVSTRIYEGYLEILRGYSSVDTVLAECESVGAELNEIIAIWSGQSTEKNGSNPNGDVGDGAAEDAGLHLVDVSMNDEVLDDSIADDPKRREAMKHYIRVQPSTISESIQLKDYQLLGLNWLRLLHRKELSCILADEMGLGKTVQVISFFAHLKEQGVPGPFLVIVPSSTLENWVREFDRFAPSLSVQTYYGSQKERIELRADLLDSVGSWEVLVTTYNLAQGNEYDKKFFRKVAWEACVFDEGHVLKNFQSQRYTNLMRINAKWRLLLTGTPLQNNLQELVSLMNFILPDYFRDAIESLRAIFKVKADSHTSLLSRERVSRAKKMMTPFVLRRRKDQVLKDLPKKTERIEWCDMTALQRTIYRDALKRSRKTLQTLPEEDAEDEKGKGKAKKKARPLAAADTSSNVLMDLRKASSHPMLFRRQFTDPKVNLMARHCLKEPEFMDSNYNLVVEDMQVMTDAELQLFCKRYKSVNKHALNDDVFLNAGKVKIMMRLLDECKAENKRVLIFSQFTQILDILKVILKHVSIKFLVLTGQTPVDERQGLVDEFTEDESIMVFLLSTKAGGMGINLTAASVVIIFDQDFNPHNDKQACDRAYRIGQKRDVEVVKLITRGTIEEDMLRLGETKLALDEAVAGDGEEGGESAPEKAMKASLMSVLRKQFEKDEEDLDGAEPEDVEMAEVKA